ncbi:hypothetical protein BKA65DRAFT_227289 [Rhexocercosporidium sp. MPI-PUGE-AT-0058]|nr:hypothetical protein BKA65DRAFT_227289 [Rhexocercosporidium sp. MPI-PUGE-AT-0058]
MEVVITLCCYCNCELGRFRNSWNGIGNSYHSPVYPPVSTIGLEATGDVYNGAKASHIEHSLLQDIACASCQAVVGLRCENAPEGHLLKENQLILRLTNMSVVTEEGGGKAKISILKSFPLTIASGKKPPGTRRAATVQPSPRYPHSAFKTPAPIHKAVVSRTPGPEDRLSLPLPNVTVSDVTKFKTWAEDAINTQQKDIDRISGTVDRIERNMRLFKDFMIAIRSELASSRRFPDSIGGEDLSALREDLDDLRRQVEENGHAISRASNDLPGRNLQDIAHDVEEVSQKVSEVDGLNSELESMRARVKSLEHSRHLNFPGALTSSRQLRPARGPSKRRHSQMNDLRSPSEDSPTEPSQKKRRVALSSPNEESSSIAGCIEKTPDHQVAPARNILEILPSEHDPSSPSRGEDYEQDQPNTPSNIENGTRTATNPTSSISALGQSSGNIRGPVSMQIPTADEGYTSVLRPGSSRLEVRVPYSTPLAMSLQQKVVRIRDSDGVLLLPNGKVDRRSLRFKGRKSGGKENAGPDGYGGDSQESETGFMKPGREWTPVMRALGSRRTMSSPASASARQDPVSPAEGNDDVKKIFKCGGCSKGYCNISGLDYVTIAFQYLYGNVLD